MSKINEGPHGGKDKRINRCLIEWQPYLTPGEYKLLDYLLFRSGLAKANKGKGWVFHDNDVAKKTGLSVGFVSQKLNLWPFIHSEGTGRAKEFRFDYDLFLKWRDDMLSQPAQKKKRRYVKKDPTLSVDLPTLSVGFNNTECEDLPTLSEPRSTTTLDVLKKDKPNAVPPVPPVKQTASVFSKDKGVSAFSAGTGFIRSAPERKDPVTGFGPVAQDPPVGQQAKTFSLTGKGSPKGDGRDESARVKQNTIGDELSAELLAESQAKWDAAMDDPEEQP